MKASTIPGFKATHVVVSDACRRTHGDVEAIEQVLENVKRSLQDALRGYPEGRDVHIHTVVTIER